MMDLYAVFWVLFGLSISLGPWIVSRVVGTLYQRSTRNKLLERETVSGHDPLTNLRFVPVG